MSAWTLRLFGGGGVGLSFIFLSQKFYPETLEVIEFARFRVDKLAFILQRLLAKNPVNSRLDMKDFTS